MCVGHQHGVVMSYITLDADGFAVESDNQPNALHMCVVCLYYTVLSRITAFMNATDSRYSNSEHVIWYCECISVCEIGLRSESYQRFFICVSFNVWIVFRDAILAN